jgi:hypothetical protein
LDSLFVACYCILYDERNRTYSIIYNNIIPKSLKSPFFIKNLAEYLPRYRLCQKSIEVVKVKR